MIHKSQESGQNVHKILLLSVSAGTGHVRAAEALRESALQHYPNAQVLHLDVMNYVNAAFRKVYADLYIKIISKLPTLWGMLYQAMDGADQDTKVQTLRRAIERVSTRKLRKAIDEFAPDAVICTHFLPAEMLTREISRQRFHVPVWMQVTDYDLHGMWVIPNMAGFFVGNQEVAFRLRAHEIEAQRIHVTGIPVLSTFAKPHQRTECAVKFGLNPARRTYLLMGGGSGVGVVPLAKRLLAANPDLQLIVLAGKSAIALEELSKLKSTRYPDNLYPLGFTNQVAELMACSDLVITKSGGLTTAECLALGVPMLATAPVPGQEQSNANYLLEHGAALKAVDELALEYRIQQLCHQPERLDLMRTHARALGRPHAARDALAIVFQHLTETQG